MVGDDRGQALVELALTLPILLLCAALLLTLSLLGVARLATVNAAAEGARSLALTNDDGEAQAAILAAAAPLRDDRLTIQIDPAAPGERPRGVIVHVSVAYRLDVPFAFAGIGAIDVSGSAARRMEYVP